jgi:hypothetical protein
MNIMKHNPLWAAIALGLGVAGGNAFAAAISCTVTPAYAILTEGQALQLEAMCDGALADVDWKMDGVSVTDKITLTSHTANTPIYYTSPVGLGASTTPFKFTVSGTPVSGQDTFGSSTEATIWVKPSSAVVAKAAGNTAPTTPVDAQCGSANNQAVTAMPSNGQMCATGKPALPVSGPQSFSWSCVSPNGGADASCYAIRGYTVTASAGMNGSVSPTSKPVATGGTATFTATPNSGYSAVFTSTCGEPQTGNGNTFTTGPVTQDCTVTVSFNNQPVNGACGSANGVPTVVAPSAGLCSAGSASSVVANTNTYTWSCNGSNGGTTSPSCSAPRQYDVTATAGANGNISPATGTVTAGSTTTFTVTPASGYAASVSGCSGTLSGTTYTTGAITGTCTVTASFSQSQTPTSDPGNGLWLPPNTTGRAIVDRGGSQSLWVSYAPGCVNGGVASNSSTGCAASASYSGTPAGTSTPYTFSFGSNRTLGIRYTANNPLATTYKYFTITSGDGGNTGGMSAWLSTDPLSTYDSTPASCRASSTGKVYVLTGPGYCVLQPGARYYLFLSTSQTGANLRFQVLENTADLH